MTRLPHRPSGRSRSRGTLAAAVLLGVVLVSTPFSRPATARGCQDPPIRPAVANDETSSAASKSPEEFDGERAMEMLEKIVALGPRVTGSKAMEEQQKLLRAHFEELGGTVWLHELSTRHPVSGRNVKVRNLVVHWHPERIQRILIGAHYDTRPYADRDPKNRRAKLPGANDGASGVGLLAELGRHMATLGPRVGVDFVLFDAEEFVFEAGRDPLFVGSTGFANAYSASRNERNFSYTAAVLVDMIGDAQLDLYWEKNSFRAAESLCREIWSNAAELGYAEFHPEQKHEIRDDHLPLINVAQIPTCDIIDFDYPTVESKNAYWHTQADTPDKCSAESLGKVGTVLLRWIRQRAEP